MVDDLFALHPAMGSLLPMFQAGDLLPIHATATSYRRRSHFDGQNVLESGGPRPYALNTGWLNRALLASGASADGMAFGRGLPLVLRGEATATSADLNRRAQVSPGFYPSVGDLYQGDPLLSSALQEGLRAQEMIVRVGGEGGRSEGQAARMAKVVGRLLASDEGPTVGVIGTSGWDTHARQSASLQRLLGDLSALLTGLQDHLEDAWQRTVVLVVSEFGRTVRGNGTGGTDHGTGGLALMAGGAVSGGRVHTDWPGLAPNDLLDGRDLRPTTDLNGVFKGVLRDHLGLSRSILDREVFPGQRVSGVADLVRG